VLFLVPTLRRAGAETQVIDLVNGIEKTQFRKTLFVFNEEMDQLDRVESESVEVIHKPRKNRFDFSVVRDAAKIIDTHNVDIIHCTLQISLLIGWLARRFSKRKPRIIIAIHTTKNVSIKQEIFDWLVYRPLIARADGVIFVCQTQAKYWKSKHRLVDKHIHVIYNGIDIERFKPVIFEQSGKILRQSLGISEDQSLVSCVAGFRREKGHFDLIRALARLGEDVQLALAGEGPYKDAVMDETKKHGLSDRVHFLGNVADVRPLLAASDITVLASTAVETFSIAMLESMAMGVPMVVTDVGGLKEAIIDGETGYVVQPGDTEGLSRSIERILEDRIKLANLGKNALKKACKDFTREKMINQTQKILTTI